MKKTSISAFLAISVLASLICGCADENNDVTTKNDSITTSAVTETVYLSDTEAMLARYEQRDLSGMPITILTTNSLNETIAVRTAPETDAVGDLVNDALFERDRLLEDYFGTSITWSMASEDNALFDLFKKEVLAGEDSFQFMIGSVKLGCLPAFNSGMCMNLSDLPHIDLSQVWWSQNIMGNFVYDNAYYMLIGEFSPRNMLSGNMLMFNLREFADRDLPSPYDMVRDGSWTYDAFKEIIRGTAADLNGDGKMKTGDFYGMNCDSTTAHSFYYGMGLTLTDHQLQPMVTGDRQVSVLEDLRTWFKSGDIDAKSFTTDTYAPNESFMNGNALFNCMCIIDLSTFRNSDTDYGIVPLPKYDEAQENYVSLGNVYAMAGLCVPLSADPESLDNLGLFIETMTALSHVKSMPEAYESTLLARETRDEESVEMLQLITESLTLDFGYLYDIGGIGSLIRTCVNGDKPVVSSFEKIMNKFEDERADLIALFGGEAEA